MSVLCIMGFFACSHHQGISLNKKSETASVKKMPIEKPKPILIAQKKSTINKKLPIDTAKTIKPVSKNEIDKSMKVERAIRDPNSNASNEFKIFSELEDAYESNNEEAFLQKRAEFFRKFPESSYIDDVNYLAGMMNAGKKNYGAALKDFDDTIQLNPSGNKVRTAMLSKAALYKRMNLPEYAKPIFEQIKKRFPGSPEALRAEIELKLISQIQ